MPRTRCLLTDLRTLANLARLIRIHLKGVIRAGHSAYVRWYVARIEFAYIRTHVARIRNEMSQNARTTRAHFILLRVLEAEVDEIKRLADSVTAASTRSDRQRSRSPATP